MSAPPDNRSTQSSCKDDSEPSQEQYDSNSHCRQPHESTSAGKPSKERVIPIFVESRNEIITPKNINPQKFHTSSRASPDHAFETDRINMPRYSFEQSPQNKSANFSRNTPSHQYFQPAFSQHQQPQQHPTQQHPPQHPPHQPQPQQQDYTHPIPTPQAQPKQATPPPESHAHHQQQQQQQSPPPPPPQQQQQQQRTSMPPLGNDPLDKIKCVKNDVLELMNQVESFQGTRKDREYLYLDEMLTRNLLKLDDIDTNGKDNIRSVRKEAIRCIQTCINNLEAKAQAREKDLKMAEQNANQAPTIESDQKNQQEPEQIVQPTFKSEAVINLVDNSNNEQGISEPKEKEQKIAENAKPVDASDSSNIESLDGLNNMKNVEGGPENVTNQVNSSQAETTHS